MQRLRSSERGFEAAFAQVVADRREAGGDVSRDVAAILADVRARGDAAVAEYTRRFDGFEPGEDWRVPPAECRAAFANLEPELRRALELAAQRIRAYHEGQLPVDRDYRDPIGLRLGARWRPVDAAGLYVPGGRAAYPSSLLMNAIPARVAGVKRLVVTTPAPSGEINPLVLAAAHICGIEEIWRIGGAQAIAALAYGTRQIAKVDVVTGPGNAFVAEAKRQLYGVVGIDMVAGPSEILVIADGDNDPAWIAADLLSQAEHDPAAQAILITDNESFAARVEHEIEALLATLETGRAARQSWDAHGLVVIVNDLAEAPALADRLAAEHVEIAVADPAPLFDAIRHAGSIFLGRHTPEAIGDYIAGPNHVLPTGRRARFASGLSVLDFMKRTSFIEAGPEVVAALGPATVALAEAEGLPAHARSVRLRLP
jgi:histidinol dehydrogenase